MAVAVTFLNCMMGWGYWLLVIVFEQKGTKGAKDGVGGTRLDSFYRRTQRIAKSGLEGRVWMGLDGWGYWLLVGRGLFLNRRERRERRTGLEGRGWILFTEGRKGSQSRVWRDGFGWVGLLVIGWTGLVFEQKGAKGAKDGVGGTGLDSFYRRTQRIAKSGLDGRVWMGGVIGYWLDGACF